MVFQARARDTKEQLDVPGFPPRIRNRKKHGDREDDKEWLKPDIGRDIYNFAHAIAHQAKTNHRQNPAEQFGATGLEEMVDGDISKQWGDEDVAVGFGSRVEDGKN